ncbi:DUF1045 domain-containing protein [Ruegeria sp. HKCCA6707]|uniref:DUF1045 domain-containing protein n=1 Tax=unclassified Ruegeria TaxID=2625375 RepID=UPI0014886808
MTFTRYALYYAPPAGAEWTAFAIRWLGWDMETGAETPHPVVPDVDVRSVTDTPRKYGLHGTMKPPFRLAEGQSFEALQAACAQFAARQKTVVLDGLEIARLGRFLALRPLGDTQALNNLAAACVQDLDAFRAPAAEAELARRRAAGLSPAQESNLLQWGYPYVLDQFRFHITLTGRLDKSTLTGVETALGQQLVPLLPTPFTIQDLALMGEAEDGRFHLIQRYALSA